MKRLRVAMVQMNSTVGDVGANQAKILSHLKSARDGGADVVVFPEMALAGYPPEDLLFHRAFLNRLDAASQALIAETAGITAVWGTVIADQALFNGAVVAADGKRVGSVQKQRLPNYGVFDEARYFSPGETDMVFTLSGWTLGVSICEDMWYPDGPYLEQARAGANVLINISASPFARGKSRRREAMFRVRADDTAAYLLWVNLVGAQDELVFDGQSVALFPDGSVLGRAPAFEEAVMWVELEPSTTLHHRYLDPRWRLGAIRQDVERVAITTPAQPERPSAPATLLAEPLAEEAELYRALVLGVRDYIGKNRFGDVLIGLSGGIDSSLTAAIAVDALGRERVHGVLMPSRITSSESRVDAMDLIERLAIDWREIAIAPVYDRFVEQLAPAFSGREPDLTEENLQARIRGTLLMALSNKFGWLVLTTGNKSEMATGYSTLYGDMAGGFAVLKDVLKTDVFRLARWRNQRGEVIPQNVLTKPPTAELRPDQKDEDSLPPYAILDQVLAGYIEEDRSIDELIAQGLPEEAVRLAVGLVNRNEYKRRQAPVGIKVTPRAFGRDRRMPITGRFL